MFCWRPGRSETFAVRRDTARSPDVSELEQDEGILHHNILVQLNIQDLQLAPCSNIIASRQYELWPVNPEPTSLGLALVSSELVAALQTASFVVQVVAVTESMNFTNAVATYFGESATCAGKMNEVTVFLASGHLQLEVHGSDRVVLHHQR